MIYMFLKLSFLYLPISQPISFTAKVTASKILEAAWMTARDWAHLRPVGTRSCAQDSGRTQPAAVKTPPIQEASKQERCGLFSLPASPSFLHGPKPTSVCCQWGQGWYFSWSMSQHCKEKSKEWTWGQGAKYRWYAEVQVWLISDQKGKKSYGPSSRVPAL